jgi:hypothetical protein
MTNTWFVMIPPGYANKSTAEKELVDFRVQYPAGSQAWDDANAGRILSPAESGEGQQLVKWQGPFATEAEAQAAQNPQQQSPNPLNDLTNAAENSNVASNPLGTLASFLGLPGGTKISGHNLLVRGAKIIIGGTLVIVGLVHITGADNAVASAARKIPLPI